MIFGRLVVCWWRKNICWFGLENFKEAVEISTLFWPIIFCEIKVSVESALAGL
jgi:hypothetical protein